MAAPVSYFGIRHHGPGSARRLLDALEDLRPVEVLIEGPADLSSLIPMLGSAEMKPPVALLAYLNDTPEDAVFWPFSEFSPEYQAICWALKNQVPVRFIDLPTHWHLLERDKRLNGEEGATEEEAEAALANNSDGTSELSSSEKISRDPIGVLATLAGYEDGESWWQDVIEENPSSGPVFAAVTDAMKALRGESSELGRWEAAREAHMRLEIAKSAKACESDQHVAVVCGAWHVPALMEKFTAKDDRALLKGVPKKKVSVTWTPWTAPRLCYHTGYGAGVASPGWCLHLWESPDNEKTTRWVIKIAKLLRESGHIVSTASLIETERLASSLASILGKPRPGYEELRDAAIATLCSGNALIWETISAELLIGSDVGAIPSDVPMAPLLEDLQRQQKKARLKPEALERELSIDLRSESGQFRSTLLHRLSILSVPWGDELDKGRSRGTFRERWRLCWEPTFAVELVENLVFGSTIQNAASGKILRRMRECGTLNSLADAVFEAMTAQLPEAANEGVKLLGARAGQTSDGSELLGSLPALAGVIRYGEARVNDSEQIEELFSRIAVQACVSLPYVVRGLDQDAALKLREKFEAANAAIALLEGKKELRAQWQDALRSVIDEAQSHRLLSGLSARLLYEDDVLSSIEAADLLSRMISPGTSVPDAAAFFTGFLEGAGQQLLYDDELRDCVDEWLLRLDEEVFVEYLPIFRRVFSQLDQSERHRLLNVVSGQENLSGMSYVSTANAETEWPKHLNMLLQLMGGDVLERT